MPWCAHLSLFSQFVKRENLFCPYPRLSGWDRCLDIEIITLENDDCVPGAVADVAGFTVWIKRDAMSALKAGNRANQFTCRGINNLGHVSCG
jgi:hypothetical protein